MNQRLLWIMALSFVTIHASEETGSIGAQDIIETPTEIATIIIDTPSLDTAACDATTTEKNEPNTTESTQSTQSTDTTDAMVTTSTTESEEKETQEDTTQEIVTSNKAGLYGTIMIHKITNYTPYSLILWDRFSNIDIEIKPNTCGTIDYPIDNYHTIAFAGSLLDAMAQHAQMHIAPINTQRQFIDNYGVFVNCALVPGGVNTGDNMIAGTIGSTVLKFTMTGLQGGARFESRPIELDPITNTVTIDLHLFIDEKDMHNNNFKLQAAYSISTPVTDEQVEQETKNAATMQAPQANQTTKNPTPVTAKTPAPIATNNSVATTPTTQVQESTLQWIMNWVASKFA